MLTGKTRLRSGWFGKLILQVEYNEMVCDRADIGDPPRSVNSWRDATIQDFPIAWKVSDEKEG